MEAYFVSKNTGPSWSKDPVYLVKVTSVLDDAIASVGDFTRYEKEDLPTTHIDLYTALPKDTPFQFVKYYMADGWWYSIVKVDWRDL